MTSCYVFMFTSNSVHNAHNMNVKKGDSSMVKSISMYGRYESKESVYQRYWKKRKDGYKQRYWKKTKRMKKVVRKDGRYELAGSGRDLYKAAHLAHRYVPKDYISISAREFLSNPEKFSTRGEWIAIRIES